MKRIVSIWRSGWLGKSAIIVVVLLVIGVIQSALGIKPQQKAATTPTTIAANPPTSTAFVDPTSTLPPSTETTAPTPVTNRLPVSRDEIQSLLESNEGISFDAEVPAPDQNSSAMVSYENKSTGIIIQLFGESASLFRVVAGVDITKHPESLEPFLTYVSPMIEAIIPSIGDGREWINSHMVEVSKEGKYIETIDGVEIGIASAQGGLVLLISPVADN